MEALSPSQLPASALHTLVFHALEQQIAVVSAGGEIVEVNRAWCAFGRANGFQGDHRWVGSNYLAVLTRSANTGDLVAAEALSGIQGVFDGQRTRFRMEYPCHSPKEQRWFMMEAITTAPTLAGHCLLVHTDITARRLAEMHANHLALHDPLTGLSNRRGFEPAFRLALRRGAREQRPLALLAVDVDHFKDYNDRHGHPAGDVGLKGVGSLLRSFCRRPDDLAARLGGDEFVVVLDDCPIDRARILADELRQAAQALSLPLASGGVGDLTLSVGVVAGVPAGEQSYSQMLVAADRALYEAKQAGRNKAVARAPSIGAQPQPATS